MSTIQWVCAFVMAALLSACGGGGGSSAAPAAQSSAKTSSASSSVTSSAASSTSSQSSFAFCASLTSDPDGDGIGLENGQSCQMRTGFDIAADMAIGWNLGNTLDATGNKDKPLEDETYWGNPKTTQANIDAVKQAGFNTLRLPVSWDDHMSGADHSIDSAWMDRVEEIANYALANNMYVIINIHHNNGWEAPTEANEASAKDYLSKIWTQIATRFQPYDHHVIFETMNEPRVAVNGVDDWSGKAEYFAVVNRLNQAALDAIRATAGNNAKRLVMLPAYVAGVSDAQVNGVVVPKDKMVAISAHAYIPYDFALNQAGTATFSDTKTIDDTFARLNNKFILNGVPVIMGEWASTDKNNLAQRLKHAEYFLKAAKPLGIPTIWWDNGNYAAGSSDIMGLLNRHNNTWVYPDLLNTIMLNK